MPVVQLNYTNTLITDTYVAELDPTINYSTSVELRSGKGSSAASSYYTLIKYDLGLIPNDATIESATLTLYQRNIPTNTVVFDIHAITEAWQQSATWNTRPNFEVESSAALSSVTTLSPISVDIKGLVQRWVNGTITNNGLLIKARDTNPIHTMVTFGSSKHTTASYRHKIDITYTIPTTGKKQVEPIAGTHTQYANSTSLAVPMPTGVQTGDLVVLMVHSQGTHALTAPAGWETRVDLPYSTNARDAIYTKFFVAGDVNPVITKGTSSVWHVTTAVFRNVKTVQSANGSQFTSSTTSHYPPAATANSDNALITLLNLNGNGYTYTPPLSYKELQETTVSALTAQISYKYLYKDRDQTTTKMTSTVSASSTGFSAYMVLEPITNNQPTLTLSSPTDNQTLSEGSSYLIEGSANDPDVGNVVTVKYQINNGPVKALESGVSSGSTPISFARTLTYRNKRIWDGATDVIGADLAENTDHFLKVWAEDDQGGKSAEVTRSFRVIHNRPPVISDQDRDLGIMEAPPEVTYSVTDPEDNPFTVTEKINGQVIRSFAGVAGRQETLTIPDDKWLRLEPGVQQILTIEATDNQGMTSTRTYNLTRFVDKITFNGMNYVTLDPAIRDKFTTDVAAKRILISPVWDLPLGANLLVEVTNNAYDANPTYEDATVVTKMGRAHLFDNTQKTANKWGINFRIHIEKGTAILPIHLKGIGGAFD